MKRALIAAAAVIVIGAIVFFSIRGGRKKGEKVYAEAVKMRDLQAVVVAPGEIDPKVKVSIGAHIVGKIDHLYFKEGDPVRKGQKLVDLERTAYQAQYDRARAELSNRRVEVVRARAALATSEAAYGRAVSLQRQGISAQELFDRSRLDHDNARAGLGSAQAGVQQAEALLAQTVTDLAHTTILSPIDGKAVQLNAHEGEVVVTGTMNNPASVIAVIADLSEILAVAEVGETEVTGIRVGEKTKIKVDAIPEKEYEGHVAEIGSSAAVRQTGGSGMRYFKVKVGIDNPDDRLRPGMTSQVSIITSTSGSALSLPIQSVVERVPPGLAKAKADEEEDENAPKRKYALVVKDGKAKLIEVKTGVSDTTHVSILSGLKAGDVVVTGPFRVLKKLKDGDPVEVTKDEPKKPASEGAK
ncbi:MAG: efflux RND transporter periplasmic adaptor subunit [Thermoanaerobaculia bacterium]